MGEAMDPMSPSNMNTDDRHVCIGTSFNHYDARLFLFDRNIRPGNELWLAGDMTNRLNVSARGYGSFLDRAERGPGVYGVHC